MVSGKHVIYSAWTVCMCVNLLEHINKVCRTIHLVNAFILSLLGGIHVRIIHKRSM